VHRHKKWLDKIAKLCFNINSQANKFLFEHIGICFWTALINHFQKDRSKYHVFFVTNYIYLEKKLSIKFYSVLVSWTVNALQVCLLLVHMKSRKSNMVAFFVFRLMLFLQSAGSTEGTVNFKSSFFHLMVGSFGR